MTPTHIGPYRIEDVLGEGAMGTVYKGLDGTTGKSVAIKTLRANPALSDEQRNDFKRRFVQEAKSAELLSHPNIVQIYNYGEENGLAYFAMEYLDGLPLSTLIAEKHPFSIDDIVQIMTQVCEGLDYAHKKGVIHRDIKPANIILTTANVAKITDFGIAKFSSSTATMTGMVVGTPSYMSPEQITGKSIDHRTDIFSAGAVLYELLTCEKAFPGDNITTVMYRVVHENPTPLSVVNMSAPAQFGLIIQKAVAKNPADRYQTASEMAADIVSHRHLKSTSMSQTQVMSAADVQATMILNDPTQATMIMTAAADKPSASAKPSWWQHPWVVGGTVALLLAVGYVFLRPTGEKKKLLPGGTASLTLRTNILEGTVMLDSLPREIRNQKVEWNDIPAGEYELVVSHEAYRPYKTRLLFAEHENKDFEIELQLAPVRIPEGIDTAYLTVTSVPEVVRVLTTTGRLIGYTPLHRIPFPSGKHTLLFSRDNYLNKTLELDLRKRGERKLRPVLDFRKGALSMAGVQPQGAEILIEGIAYRPTRNSGIAMIPVGNHEVTFQKTGFRSLSRPLQINDQDTLRPTISLEPIFGALVVSSDPPGAEIYTGGKRIGVTPFRDDRFPAGVHLVRIQKGQLFSVKRVLVDENREAKTHVSLQASIGIVRLLVDPWATVFVNGRNQGATPPLDNLALEPGTYEIQLENPAFAPVRKTITVKAGTTTTLQHEFK